MDMQGDGDTQGGEGVPAQAASASDSSSGKKRRAVLIWILAGILVVLIVLITVGLFIWRPWSISPTPTQTASTETRVSSATPTPTPTPVPASLTISITELTLTDSAGAVVWTHALTDDGNAVAADLQAAFGIAPAVTDHSGDEFSFYETEYRWDGFVLITNRATWDDFADSQLRAYEVWGQAPAVGPISITTPEGIQVGQPADVLAPFADASTFDSGTTTCYVVERDPAQGVDDPARGGMFTGPFLGICSNNASALVSSILSPDYLFIDN